ncbi:MAG: endonuclease/exonuclease/phosphatase family protein [Parasphingorhabdus sp.]|uniref:endonuclease/exonuclease/phosphatase family protein n=1 Tax=Parasphingorhabdus sp. TaxID=2709688 RepID=UPI0030014C53
MAQKKLRVASHFAMLSILAALPLIGIFGVDISLADSLNIAAPLWIPVGLIASLLIAFKGYRARGFSAKMIFEAGLFCGYFAFLILLIQPFLVKTELENNTHENTILKIISFNLNKNNSSPAKAAQWIIKQAPDAIVLLESDREGAKVAKLLARQFPVQYDCRGDGACSTVILLKSPAIEVKYHGVGDTENRKALSAVTAKIWVGDSPLSLTAVHLPHPWPLGEPRKYINELVSNTDIFDGRRLLVGDFNNVPWSFSMQNLAANMRLRLASGAAPTWSAIDAMRPLLALDQVYAGDCVNIISTSVGPPLGSDHLPVITEFWIGTCDD